MPGKLIRIVVTKSSPKSNAEVNFKKTQREQLLKECATLRLNNKDKGIQNIANLSADMFYVANENKMFALSWSSSAFAKALSRMENCAQMMNQQVTTCTQEEGRSNSDSEQTNNNYKPRTRFSNPEVKQQHFEALIDKCSKGVVKYNRVLNEMRNKHGVPNLSKQYVKECVTEYNLSGKFLKFDDYVENRGRSSVLNEERRVVMAEELRSNIMLGACITKEMIRQLAFCHYKK